MLSTINDTAHSTLGEKSNKMSVSLMASAMAQDESDEAKGYGRKTSDKKKFSRPATLKAGHNFDRDD